MKRYLATIITSIIVALGLAAGALPMQSASASAVRVEKADRKVKAKKVAYVEQVRKNRLYVEFNDGSAFRFTPCRYEDGRNCYWLGGKFGNGHGKSFVDLRGRLYYFKG